MSPRLKTLRRLSTIAASGLLGLLLLEVYARLAERIGYGTQRVITENMTRDGDILDAIRAGHSPLAPDARTILVLGDSMAAAQGVARPQVWSTLLTERLRLDVDPRAFVVNAGTLGANSYQELLISQEILPLLKPEAVLLMYNTNDVYGTHGSRDGTYPPQQPDPGRPDETPESGPKFNNDRAVSVSGFAHLISFLKRDSVALKVLLPRINIQLKAWGYLVPGTEYHHMVTKAYRDDYDGWVKTRAELKQLRDECKRHNAKLIVYLLPSFDVLKFNHSAIADRIVTDYFRSIDVPIVIGFDHFRDRVAEELALSPFDGHPNPKANREIAQRVEEWIAATGTFPRRKAPSSR